MIQNSPGLRGRIRATLFGHQIEAVNTFGFGKAKATTGLFGKKNQQELNCCPQVNHHSSTTEKLTGMAPGQLRWEEDPRPKDIQV